MESGRCRVAVSTGRVASGLRLLRENARLSQRVVAGRLGITEASYSRWEAGQVPLRVSDLEALRELFRVGWGTFFDALGMTPERDYQPVKDWLADRQLERLTETEGNTSQGGDRHTPSDAIPPASSAPAGGRIGRFPLSWPPPDPSMTRTLVLQR